MSLLVFNGSPRGKKSNSQVITRWFTKGYAIQKSLYLFKVKQYETFIEEAKNYDQLMFVFPLYVDGMPAQVKQFFEDMDNHRDIFKDKEVIFIIHSGFSEAIHLKNLEQYLYRFTDIMGMNNYGVFNLPGSEGFRIMPKQMLEKKARYVNAIGRSYRLKQVYNKKIKNLLEGPLLLSKAKLTQFKFLQKIGMHNIYWDNQLKKNNVFEQRFATPYKNKD